MTESALVRHVHREEVLYTVDLQPKKKTQKATYIGTTAIHRIGVDGKDQNRSVRPLAGREFAEEHPTTADLLPKTEKPKTKRPKKRRGTPRPKPRSKPKED
jgi:hypothetical protein